MADPNLKKIAWFYERIYERTYKMLTMAERCDCPGCAPRKSLWSHTSPLQEAYERSVGYPAFAASNPSNPIPKRMGAAQYVRSIDNGSD